MNHQIEIQADVDVPENVDKALVMAVLKTLANQSSQPIAMTILLTDDARIQLLNQDFRGLNQPTDVLSFSAGEPLPGSSDKLSYLGDVAISLPFARRQAQESGHNLVAELQLLAVHGVLHLIGYDHITDEEKVCMWSLQEEILNQLELQNIIPTET